MAKACNDEVSGTNLITAASSGATVITITCKNADGTPVAKPHKSGT